MVSKEELKLQISAVLKKHQVKKAALFGSFAKDEATKDSDIDIVVELGDDKSLLDLVEIKLELEEVLKKNVDVITYDSIHPLLRDKILDGLVVLL